MGTGHARTNINTYIYLYVYAKEKEKEKERRNKIDKNTKRKEKDVHTYDLFLAARLFWLGCTGSFYTNAITYILVIPYVILYSFEDINCEAILLCF